MIKIGGMKMKKITSYDLTRINEYFEEAGIVYTENDEILASESIEEVAHYLIKTNPSYIVNLMKRITDIQEGDNMLETLIGEVSYAWYDYENGKYYVIVQ